MATFPNTIAFFDEKIRGVLAFNAPCSNKDEGIESYAYYEDIPDEDKSCIDTLLDKRWVMMPEELKTRLSVEYEALLEVIIRGNR